MDSYLKNYIDGKWVNETAHGTYPVTNPADGRVIARVPALQAAETRRAHEAIAQAVQRGDARLAERLMHAHSGQASTHLGAQFSNPGAPSTSSVAPKAAVRNRQLRGLQQPG